MKQTNPPFSRTRRGVFVSRIVFLVTLVAAVVFVATRGNFTSSASDKPAIATSSSADGRITPSAKAYASAPGTSMLPFVCTTDPVVVNNANSGAGSLRQAIVDACVGSTITFNMTMVTSPITLTTAELSINQNLTITGPGSSLLTIARSSAGGTPKFRIFNIVSGTVNISGLTLTNGNSADGIAGNSGSTGENGGGILNAGTLTLTDVTVTSNRAGAGGAGLSFGGFGGSGGGIANIGTLTMANCAVNGNSTGKGGAGNNSVGDGGEGGGIYTSGVTLGQGALSMTNCVVNGNTAGDSGDTAGVGGRGGSGGGIFSRSSLVSLTSVGVNNNLAGSVPAGNGANNGFGGMGGGIYSILGVATLTNCTVSGNQTGTTASGGTNGYGGGIYNDCSMTIVGSTISGNTGNVSGAIMNRRPLTAINSTVSGNHSFDGSGPAINNGTSNSTLSLTNCTITGNDGLAFTYPTTTVRNTIIAGNGPNGDVPGGMFGSPATSQGNNLIGKSDGPSGFTDGVNGDQVGSLASPLDPRLGPLANNGGPTQTHALLANSTAIDAGNNCVVDNSCTPALGFSLTTDQRGAGFARSTDGNGDGTATVDIGAYEVGIILVTNTDDSGPGSLRQAITDANVDADTHAIIFQAGLTGTITLLSALPDLSTSMSINGPGANQMIVQRSTAGGTPNFRIFKINSGTTVTIRNLTISNGKFINSGDLGAGVLNNGTLTLANCNIYGNQAVDLPERGGGIYSDGPSLIVNDCNIGGLATGQPNIGGGIVSLGTFATLSITGGSVVGNTSGGIFFAGADATLNRVSITNNTGTSATGGFWSNGSTPNVKILNCLIANNTGQNGGGLRNAGGTHLVVNTTISGNTSLGFGGGLDNAFGNTTLINVTITNNRAQDGGGVFNWSGVGIVLLQNTIVAGNFRGASPSTTPGDITNLVSSSSSFSLIGSCDGCGLSNGVNNNQVGVADPGLAVLANYGGPTQTHALLPGSPALNAGSNALATNAGLTTDQRGFARIVNTTVDIGSFESRGFTIAATSGTPQSAPITTAFGSSLVATVSSAFGEPVAGGVVIFTAPSSGASGTFPGNVTTANASINASGVATAPTFTANGIAGGPYNVVASLAGGSPSSNFSLTNLKGNQTITVNTHAPASATYNTGFTVAATSSSGLAVSYSSSGACTNVGATFTMTSGTGTCTVKYDQAGDTNFNAATQVTESVTAQKASQTITVNTHAPASATYNTGFTVAATSSSGLAVSYSSSGVCTNVGATFTMTSGTGTCTVKYDQAGDTNFNAATQMTELVTAQKASQTITVNTHAPASATYNISFTVAATSSSSLAVSYSSSGVCTNVGATFTMTSGTGTCTVKYDQAGDTNFNAATQVTESVTAQRAATSTSLSSSLNPSALGQSVTFTATVTSTAGTPTGTVTFKDNGVAITGCSNKTLVTGQATCDTSGLQAGNHPITADYNGDTNFATSTGTLAGGQVVTPPPSVQFSSSTYNKSESGPSTNITVTRTGDTSGASAVNFSTGNNSYVPCNTINGVTTQNCDFIISSGTLNFAAGQTSRSFPIIIIDDVFVEGDETLSLSLSNPAGALLGSPSTATLTIIDNDSVTPATNPLDDARFFVRTHYYDFLGRLPDDGGLDYWTNEITKCGSNTACINERRVAVSNAFFYEQEYQQTASFVFLLYRASFGNNQPFPNPDFFDSNLSPSLHDEAKKLPRYLSFARDRVQVVGGSDLAQTQLALASAFVQRPEFVTKYPLSLATAAQFVDAVLATIRNDSGAELVSQRDTLIGHFNTGGRGLVMFHLANDYWNGCNRLPGSPPAPCVPVGYGDAVDNRAFIDAEYNRSFVYSQYSGYLRRDGDIVGFLFWLTEVSKAPPRNVEKQRGMVCSFITSEEYQRRFSSVVTHSNAECGN